MFTVPMSQVWKRKPEKRMEQRRNKKITWKVKDVKTSQTLEKNTTKITKSNHIAKYRRII